MLFCISLLNSNFTKPTLYHIPSAPKVLVTTGLSSNSGTKRTEVIDVENSDITCKDLEDFPMDSWAATGTNLTSMPIICGGWTSTYSDKCFKVCSCL